MAGAIELIENGAKFVADLSEGQKTGWFYDQRDNRRFMAGLAKDAQRARRLLLQRRLRRAGGQAGRASR